MRRIVVILASLLLLNCGAVLAQISVTQIQESESPAAVNTIRWKNLDYKYQVKVHLKGSGFNSLVDSSAVTLVIDSVSNVPKLKGTLIKKTTQLSMLNDQFISVQLISVDDDSNADAMISFSKFASTGEKKMAINGKLMCSVWVTAPDNLPKFSTPIAKQSIRISEATTVYFPVDNINNYDTIKIEHSNGGGDLSGIQVSSVIPDYEQSRVVMTLKISDNKYFTERYKVYLIQKDRKTVLAPSGALVSELFERTTLDHKNFKDVTLYSNNKAPLFLTPDTGLTLEPGKYRLKNFNGQDYDLKYISMNGAALKSDGILAMPTDLPYGGEFQIVRIESNIETPIGYYVKISVYPEETFSNIILTKEDGSQINTVLISSDSSKNRYILEMLVSDYSKTAGPLNARMVLIGPAGSKIFLKEKSQEKVSAGTKYRFTFTIPPNSLPGVYTLEYYNLSSDYRECAKYEFKVLNTPLTGPANVVIFSYQIVQDGQKTNKENYVGTGEQNIIDLEKSDYNGINPVLIIDLTSPEIAKNGDQRIQTEVQIIDNNNNIVGQPQTIVDTYKGGQRSAPLSIATICGYTGEFKPWYSIKIKSTVIVNPSFYSVIPQAIQDKASITIADQEVVFDGNYKVGRVGVSLPLQQSAIVYNKKADVSSGQKKWTAAPYTLSINLTCDIRRKAAPKSQYHWFMFGGSILCNASKLSEGDSYYVGLLPFIGFRLQNEMRYAPNIIIGGGYSYHLRQSDNFSQISPVLALRFGWDFSK